MNVQLHKVVSDITGTTGMIIIRAIVAGERDPQILTTKRLHRTKRYQDPGMDYYEQRYQEQVINNL